MNAQVLLPPGMTARTGLYSQGVLAATRKPKLTWARGENGKKVLSVSDIAVFRSGTFRDSMGVQHTWEDMQINQMILNFDHLKSSGVFESVPVRKGHGSFLGDAMDSLIGWHTALRAERATAKHDGKEHLFLFADYEIFDEEAANHIAENHWRNRSAEIGYYVTNDEAEYFPVYMGVAYVDIPAVEGLNGFSKSLNHRTNFNMLMEGEESQMGDQNNTGGTSTPPETNKGGEAAPTGVGTSGPPAEPQPVAQPAAQPVTNHGAQVPAFAFTINGAPTTDFAAVQAHIATLESFKTDTLNQDRKNFVTGLVEGNKILASQKDGLTAFALGLSSEQFTAWADTFKDVPANPLFAAHGVQSADLPGGGTGQHSAAKDEKSQEEKDLEAIVESHYRRKMPEDQIKATQSYKRLEVLRASRASN